MQYSMMRRPLTILFAALLAWACSHSPTHAASGDAPPVRIYDTHGSSNEANWTVVTGTPSGLDPTHTVIENGCVRVTYPALLEREKAGCQLYVFLHGHYVLASDPDYGDWTYTGSSFIDDYTSFTILENDDSVARVQLNFANHVHEFENNLPLPVQKTIVLHRGAYGYRAIVNVPSTVGGEREIGFGGTRTHLFTYSTRRALLWSLRKPPRSEDRDYLVRDEGQESGDWWGASVAFSDSFYRLVSVRPEFPGGIRTGQFTAGVTGHLIHWVYSGFSSYEAFIGAAPYDGSQARRVSVRDGIATIIVPATGKYTLYTRAIEGLHLVYLPVPGRLRLKAGINSVPMKNAAILRAPIVVPYSDGLNFPEDISAQYRAGAFD